MHPHLKCRRQQVAVFKKHVSFCLVSRVPEATFMLLTSALLTAWLSHPLITNLQSLAGRARRARGMDILLRTRVDSCQTSVHLESCLNHRFYAQNLVHRCPRSVRQKLAHPVMLLGFVLISACCVAKLGIVHQNVPTKEKRLILTWQPCMWYLRSVLCCVRCHVLRCNGRENRRRSRPE